MCLENGERGKCFIEYIPAENAWAPISADGYMYIDCLWVSGSFKGHGYSTELLNACVAGSKEKVRKGLCILSSAKKKPFHSCQKKSRREVFAIVIRENLFFLALQYSIIKEMQVSADIAAEYLARIGYDPDMAKEIAQAKKGFE